VRNLPLEWLQLWGDQEAVEFFTKVEKEAAEWSQEVASIPNSLLTIPWEDKGSGIHRVNSEFLRLLGKVGGDEDARRPSDPYLLKLAEVAKVNGLLRKGADAYRDENGEFTPLFYDSWYAALQSFVRRGLMPTRHSYHVPVTGRLHSIPEPAGKVRVVAICDYFTQLGLKPLHEYIFKLLKCNTNDATFGQQEAVDHFASQGHTEIFSYDLKAATDLIPIQLYREVLEPLIGRKGSDLWSELLANRTFLAPKDIRKGGQEFVRYSRGQPMGALSSWACLALCHHALVQFAAKRAGLDGWFSAYLVLGDDIVIADKRVAEAYLSVCGEFGIKVGLAKSLVSAKGLMNFASQTLLGADNLSPVSLGEELVALTWARRLEMANRINHRYGTGSGAKSDMLALRRVLTANQWAALQSDLQGGGVGWKVRFVRFLLQNPFTRLTAENRLYVESVVEWLGLLCPELLRLSQTRRDELHNSLRHALWEDLKIALQRKLREYRDSIKESAGIVNSSRYSTFEAGSVLWRYLSKALGDHFRMVRERDLWTLEETVKGHDTVPDFAVIAEYWVLLSKVPAVSGNFTDGPRENVFSVIKDQARAEDLALAEPVRVGKIGAVKGKTPVPLAPKESLRAPLQALLLAVGRALGVVLPVLKLVDRPASKRFSTLLYAGVKEFERNRIERDASPPWSSSPLCPVVIPVIRPEALALVRVDDEDC
jgi:hypothetical protein